jgi:hypothetical protein
MLILALLALVIAPTVPVDWIEGKPDILVFGSVQTGQETTKETCRYLLHRQNWDDGHRHRCRTRVSINSKSHHIPFRSRKQPPGTSS